MNYRLNFQIKFPTVRLIGQDGKPIGIFSNSDAQKMAQNNGLDLVEINANQRPPICKIMDFGKFKYETEKKEKELKKKNKVLPIKEIQFSPNVEENDVNIKIRKIREFLSDGHHVKISMRFKGRDLSHLDLGRETFNKIIGLIKNVSVIETPTEFTGNMLMLIVSPVK